MDTSGRGKSKRAFSTSFKLKVVELAEQKGRHHAAKLFGADRKRVRQWCQSKEKCGISNVLDRTKDGLFQASNNEDTMVDDQF